MIPNGASSARRRRNARAMKDGIAIMRERPARTWTARTVPAVVPISPRIPPTMGGMLRMALMVATLVRMEIATMEMCPKTEA